LRALHLITINSPNSFGAALIVSYFCSTALPREFPISCQMSRQPSRPRTGDLHGNFGSEVCGNWPHTHRRGRAVGSNLGLNLRPDGCVLPLVCTSMRFSDLQAECVHDCVCGLLQIKGYRSAAQEHPPPATPCMSSHHTQFRMP